MINDLSKRIHSNLGAWIAAGATAVLAFSLYVRTVHPGVGPFLDSIEYQTTVAALGVSHPPGYPLYTFLGKLFSLIPWGNGLAHWGDNPAWRLNMMSVVFSSVTALLTVRLAYRMTRHTVIALLTGLTLAGAVRFWYQASYTELYPVYTMMVVDTFLLLLDWMATRRAWLYFASAAVYALSFGVNAPAIV
ncbi:MAG: protein O-mannosyl-transferase family, partial [Anaerolineae bacterium]